VRHTYADINFAGERWHLMRNQCSCMPVSAFLLLLLLLLLGLLQPSNSLTMSILQPTSTASCLLLLSALCSAGLGAHRVQVDGNEQWPQLPANLPAPLLHQPVPSRHCPLLRLDEWRALVQVLPKVLPNQLGPSQAY
jgi:hypothetical protein